jgi:phosphocarrier protein
MKSVADNSNSSANAKTREFEVRNKYGIHARPAALIVKASSGFDADVTIEKDGNSVSGKSIMGLMSLEAGRGSVLRVTVSGEDCEEALDHLEELIVQRKFDED